MFLFTPCTECYGYANCLRIPIDRQESNKREVSPWHSSKTVFRATDSDALPCCFV